MSEFEYTANKAAADYSSRHVKVVGLIGEAQTSIVAERAFAAGAEWARAQWPITPRTAEEAKPADFGQSLGLMWADLGKKLDELSIWCGALEGQANRIDREQRAMIVDVGQKVEAVISLVDDLDELIRSEDGEAIEVAREDEADEAYRPAVGMFGIGGDASVASIKPGLHVVEPCPIEEEQAEMYDGADVWKTEKRPTPTLRNVLKAIEDVRALAVDAGIQFDFSVSTRS